MFREVVEGVFERGREGGRIKNLKKSIAREVKCVAGINTGRFHFGACVIRSLISPRTSTPVARMKRIARQPVTRVRKGKDPVIKSNMIPMMNRQKGRDTPTPSFIIVYDKARGEITASQGI